MQLRNSTRQATVNSKNVAQERLKKLLHKRMAKQQPVSTVHVGPTSDEIAQGDNIPMASISPSYDTVINVTINNNMNEPNSPPVKGRIVNGVLVTSNDTVMTMENSTIYSIHDSTIEETPVRQKQSRTKQPKKKLNRIRLSKVRSFAESFCKFDGDDEISSFCDTTLESSEE